MKTVFRYIYFFFYTALNWSPWLAFFMLYHDIRGGIKYRVRTFFPVKLHRLTITGGDISKSSSYEAVNYYMLEELLEAFCQLSSCRSIVDLGCGKGRVMVVAAYFGFTSIKGIDFAKELCREASSNMRKTEANIPSMQWEVINADVLDYTILPEDKVFFMFNPFVEEILVVFLDRLEKSCQQFHRKIYFLYASPQHAAVLLDRGFKVIFQQSIMNMYGLILVKH